MTYPFANRNPTPREIERLRLILSTYQDGTGMLFQEDGTTLPGWRDFERSVALAFGGEAQESKFIFDVLLPDPSRQGVSYGLACKMRGELDRIAKDGRVTIELSNSARKFWDHLNAEGIDQTNYREFPQRVGISLVGLIERWHRDVSPDSGGMVDLDGSSYLVLSWNRERWYQLHLFSLEFPDPSELEWHFPIKTTKGGIKVPSRRMVGEDSSGILFEWYGESGGQLKYYPLAENAIWASDRFQLEPLGNELEHGLLHKVATYFPEQWKKVFRG
jgi:hypothetical protein